MPFSEEQINEITQNAGELVGNETVLPVLREAFKSKGFHVMNDDDRISLLENYKASEMPKLISEETKTIHGHYDKDLAEIYGQDNELIKPKEGESKTYQINKRLHQHNLAKIKELEAKLAAGDHKEFYEKKLQEEQEKARLAIEAERKKASEIESNFAKMQKEIKLGEIYAPIKAKVDPARLEDDLFLESEKSIKQFALSNSGIVDGQYVMLNEDGSVMKNESYQPILVADFLTKKFQSAFKKDPPSGGGTKPGDGKGGNVDLNNLSKETYDPGNVTSKSELIDAMARDGISTANPKYPEIFLHNVQIRKLK